MLSLPEDWDYTLAGLSRKGLSMTEYTPKLVEALLSGGSVDEIFRQEIERAVNTLLETEITAFLGYERYAVEGYNSGDSRNGSYTRTIHSRYGDIQLNIPRDHNGQFKQQTVPPYERNTDSLEETVIHLYRKGITTSEIADLIEKMYGHHYSRGTISNMAANMQAEVEAFHKRPLSTQYVVIYADATYLSVRRDCVDKEAFHVLLALPLMAGRSFSPMLSIPPKEPSITGKCWLISRHAGWNRFCCLSPMA